MCVVGLMFALSAYMNTTMITSLALVTTIACGDVIIPINNDTDRDNSQITILSNMEDFSETDTNELPANCAKIEQTLLGREELEIVTNQGTAIVVTSWITKLEEESQYIGFTFISSEPVSCTVWTDSDSYSCEEEDEWVYPDSAFEQRGITDIVFCGI